MYTIKDFETALHSKNKTRINQIAQEIDVTLRNTTFGNTPLILAIEHDCQAAVEILLEREVDIEAKNEDGTTALMRAARLNRLAAAQALLARKAAVDARDRFGKTALMSATGKGNIEIVNALLTARADVNAQDQFGYTALMSAAKEGDIEIVNALLAAGAGAKVNAQGQYGNTALMSAAKKGDIEIVIALLLAEADVNAEDRAGNTALMSAAKKGNIKIVNVLLAAGADVNAQDRVGNTALIYAAEEGDIKIVNVLLAAGAKVNAQNQHGYTALDYAMLRIKCNAVNALLDAGATLPLSRVGFKDGLKRGLKYVSFVPASPDYGAYQSNLLTGADTKRHLILGNPNAAELKDLLSFLQSVKGKINTVILASSREWSVGSLCRYHRPEIKIANLGEEEEVAELLLRYIPALDVAKLGLRNFIIKDLAHTKESYPQYYIASHIVDKIKTDWTLIPKCDQDLVKKHLDFLEECFALPENHGHAAKLQDMKAMSFLGIPDKFFALGLKAILLKKGVISEHTAMVTAEALQASSALYNFLSFVTPSSKHAAERLEHAERFVALCGLLPERAGIILPLYVRQWFDGLTGLTLETLDKPIADTTGGGAGGVDESKESDDVVTGGSRGSDTPETSVISIQVANLVKIGSEERQAEQTCYRNISVPTVDPTDIVLIRNLTGSEDAGSTGGRAGGVDESKESDNVVTGGSRGSGTPDKTESNRRVDNSKESDGVGEVDKSQKPDVVVGGSGGLVGSTPNNVPIPTVVGIVSGNDSGISFDYSSQHGLTQRRNTLTKEGDQEARRAREPREIGWCEWLRSKMPCSRSSGKAHHSL